MNNHPLLIYKLKRSLLLLMLPLAFGCSTTDETPTSFLDPPAQVNEIITEAPVSETRALINGKRNQKRVNQRTVNHRTVNAVTLFPFEENKIYKLATCPGYFTSLFLEPGERMPGKVALGDPSPENWLAEKTAVGSTDGVIVVLLLKPGTVGISTNMLILTDRRAYQLDVTSYKKRAMDMVKWTYPERENSTPQNIGLYEASIDPTAINRNYSIELAAGERPNWMPVAAYDFGGTRTYIEFPARLGQIAAPAIFVVDQNRMAVPASFRPRGRFYEVSRAFSVAELRLGTTIVRISRISS